jgi:hypothetical protein
MRVLLHSGRHGVLQTLDNVQYRNVYGTAAVKSLIHVQASTLLHLQYKLTITSSYVQSFLILCT